MTTELLIELAKKYSSGREYKSNHYSLDLNKITAFYFTKRELQAFVDAYMASQLKGDGELLPRR